MREVPEVPEAHVPSGPLVSVVVPAYNAGATLSGTVERLLGQTFASTEIVLVDDGSTDDTAAVGGELAARHPSVRFFRQPQNGGVARARERGVRESRGEYVWFVDADDTWAVDALERLTDAAAATGADVVVCSAEYVQAGRPSRPIPAPRLAAPVPGADAFPLLLEGSITGHLWNKLFRRRLVEGIEFTAARVHSDLAMTAQLLAAAERVTAIPDTLYSYTLRPGSIIRSGTRRAESLALVDAAVTRAARGLGPGMPHSPAFRYFQLRYVILSGIKDALHGPYTPAERTALLAALRPRLTMSLLLLVARRRDWRRLALAATARASMPLHRRLLRVAAEPGAGGPTGATGAPHAGGADSATGPAGTTRAA